MLKRLIILCFVFSGFLPIAHASWDDVPHRVYIGGGWQNLNSIWSNDTKQRGSMGGGIVGYDFQKRNYFYVGINVNYMQGKLHGSAGNDLTREYFVEGRMGYTISPCCCESLMITPYSGAGYCVFDQSIGEGMKFKSRFWYIPFGARLEYYFNAYWKIGLRGFVGPMFSGRWKVTESQKANVWLIWKAELPITFSTCLCGEAMDISLIPFVREWAYRKKGELIGQKNIYGGVQLQFGYHF